MAIRDGHEFGQLLGHLERRYITGFDTTVGVTATPIWPVESQYTFPAEAAVLHVVSSSADDAAAGSGARTILVEGLDENFAEASETFTLNGTTGVTGSVEFIRVNSVAVLTSGTYGTSATGRNIGNITVRRVNGSGDILSYVLAGAGRSSQAIFTVPAGRSWYVAYGVVNVETNKIATVKMYQRPNADQTTGSVSCPSVVMQIAAGAGQVDRIPMYPVGPFAEKTDVWVMANTDTGTAIVDVELELLLSRG